MRAKPILRLGAVAGALMLPSAAGALGLGKLTVDSALGQPLSAQIEVTAVAPGELDTLSVKIADPSLYWLREGAVVRLTSDTLGLTNRKAVVRRVRATRDPILSDFAALKAAVSFSRLRSITGSRPSPSSLRASSRFFLADAKLVSG